MKEYRAKLIEVGIESPEYHFAMTCVKEGRGSILMSDGGESIIDRILEGYCSVHPGMMYLITQLKSELKQ
jgi:hypothetical protein